MEFCSIASGSSGNCTLVKSGNTAILIDAGISCKRITEGLHSIDMDPSDLSGILITHEHSDHISGLSVLARKYDLPVYATVGTLNYILAHDRSGKLNPERMSAIRPDESFRIGGLLAEGFHISHDAADPCGYRSEDGKRSMAVATDLGCYDDYIISHLSNLDGLLLEANHDVNMLQCGAYPYPLKMRILGMKGHLSNESAGALLCDILHDGIKRILLGHLSKENNYEALAYAAVSAEVTLGDNPYKGEDLPICVASRDCPTPVFAL